MNIKNFLLAAFFIIAGIATSCKKEVEQIGDQLSDYHVKCDIDTTGGLIRFNTFAPIGKFEKNTKSVIITAQALGT
ncbi:MAG: hypothetical protein ACK4ON_11365, partial [Bacteroidia bacterium]